MSRLPFSVRDRAHYGIPESMALCPCGDDDCMYFTLGYPYCHGCGDHHRMPVALMSTDERCPVDVMQDAYDIP